MFIVTVALALAGIFVATQAYIVQWYYDMGHAPVEKLSFLSGKSIDEVESILGAPDDDLIIPLAQVQDGFRCELLNFYSPKKPENKEVVFKELSWKRSRYTITVWFHNVGGRWLCLDTCRWRKGVAF